MSNDPKADLIYAILTMDSYNRGYGFGITNLGAGSADKIGEYSIVQDISQTGWFTAGFYAIAYRNGTDTVISYRGTDDNIGGGSRGGSDARNGYGLALGATPDSVFKVATDQARLAAEFYTSVTTKTDSEAAGSTVLTGHSLGGGLAGYVGLTSGTQAITFDHLPFDLANDNQAQRIAA